MVLNLSSNEVNLLKYFGLITPADVLEYYRRTKHPLLEDLYLKTIGALNLLRR